jgi:peptidyl-prolyl cis-trans isomerase SurA
MIAKSNLFFVIILTLFYNFEVYAQNIKIIVKVENELITSYDIKNKIISTLILNNKEITQKNIDNLKKISLDILIQNRLKKIELKKTNLKKPVMQIDSYLNSISSNNVENLKKLFQANNLDFKNFENELETEFKWKSFIYNIYSKSIVINEEDVAGEIKKITSDKKKLKRFNLSEIEIFINENVNYNEVVDQIKNEILNNGFESAVNKFSISETSTNNGKLGWINSSSLSKDIFEIVNKMKVGETTKPLKKQDRVIFLKLNDKKISNYSDINIEELKIELINKKKEELFTLYSNSYLSKLRNSKIIQYYK